MNQLTILHFYFLNYSSVNKRCKFSKLSGFETDFFTQNFIPINLKSIFELYRVVNRGRTIVEFDYIS